MDRPEDGTSTELIEQLRQMSAQAEQLRREIDEAADRFVERRRGVTDRRQASRGDRRHDGPTRPVTS
jgi:hypothetical protein